MVALYCRYPGGNQTHAQPCHLELDPSAGKVTLGYTGEVGPPYAVPAEIYHQRIIHWAIPCLNERGQKALLAAIAPLVPRVCAGHEIEWDDRQGARVGTLTEDARSAADDISRLCEESGGEGLEIVAMQAEDYLATVGGSRRQAKTLGIAGDTSDARMEEIAESLSEESARDGVDVLDGLGRYLEFLRDACRDACREAMSAESAS